MGCIRKYRGLCLEVWWDVFGSVVGFIMKNVVFFVRKCGGLC